MTKHSVQFMAQAAQAAHTAQAAQAAIERVSSAQVDSLTVSEVCMFSALTAQALQPRELQ